jgi:hypothetical protein
MGVEQIFASDKGCGCLFILLQSSRNALEKIEMLFGFKRRSELSEILGWLWND